VSNAGSATERYTCLGCPIGCALELVHEGAEIVEVSGNRCKRGAKYARQEFTDPRRGLSTTVAIHGARWARLPVKTSGPVPKARAMEAARLIHGVEVDAPVEMGQVLLENLLGEPGLHVVASCTLPRAPTRSA
jgi:CxxC motif-containing protein